MLQAIEENFERDFNYCSYSSPNCNITQLLAGIKSKLRYFNMNDYCIIVLGETDIRTNDNLINMVKVINV